MICRRESIGGWGFFFSICASLEFSSLTVAQLPEAHSDPQRATSHLHPAALLRTSGQLSDQPSGLRGESPQGGGSLQVFARNYWMLGCITCHMRARKLSEVKRLGCFNHAFTLFVSFIVVRHSSFTVKINLVTFKGHLSDLNLTFQSSV